MLNILEHTVSIVRRLNVTYVLDHSLYMWVGAVDETGTIPKRWRVEWTQPWVENVEDY